MKRESAINRARRKYYGERPWEFLSKVGATLTFTAKVASLPSDFNKKYPPKCVYKYDGDVKYEFLQVEWADLSGYLTDKYAYALDPVNGTIKVNQTDATLSLDYRYLPSDRTAIDNSQDAEVEPAPDITAISLLATAYFYLSSRQSKGSYAQFLEGYKEQVREDEKADGTGNPVRFFHRLPNLLNRGYKSY